MVICDDCQPEVAGPVAPDEAPSPHTEPEQVPSHHTERKPGQLFLHDVHSPATPEGEQFSYVMDSSRSPEEIVAFAAGVDYGVRKHLDLFIEVLRRTMDAHEHTEATLLTQALAESNARIGHEAVEPTNDV